MSKLSRWERIGVVALVLSAWLLRWIALMDVPPGWRDDDLIELYTFSGRIVEEGPQLYFAGASGHEPLYHTLRAPLVAIAGINAASARLMSAGAGTLAALLTWAAGRRILGRIEGLLAGALVAISFWGLLYSRVAIRHMAALPWMLLAIYWGWRLLRDRRPPSGAFWGVALGTGGALLTYYAGRLMPVFLVALLPLAGPRRQRWPSYILGLALGVGLAAPMFWAAAQLPGADARIGEVAVPLTALQDGDLRPLLQTTWTTLGMFHAKGDPEWLYNYSERPVFGPVMAVTFYLSLILALARWRRPANRLLLLWLAVGLSPAFVSLPPSSYGHTIMALPAVYLLLASMVAALRDRRHAPPGWLCLGLGGLLLLAVGARDLPGYFYRWPGHSMVRFLYRADYRALSEAVCDRAEITDIAVGSMLYGVWDKVALRTDCTRAGLRPRWLDPARALVFAGGRPTPLYLQDEGTRCPEIAGLLATSESMTGPEGMDAYLVEPVFPPDDAVTRTLDGMLARDQPFEGALALEAVAWSDSSSSGNAVSVATWWHVEDRLPLPAEELMPQPPPPGVYSGPRLKVFAHLRVGGKLVATDDGIWVDVYSLQPGDLLLQYHSFELPGSVAPERITLVLGLYDPQTGIRWTTAGGADSLELSLPAGFAEELEP
ncbi:MAG: glycosyltransferase family 39 protein [Anaerolineae bacterium]|nr:glycosyltransferase family 39 protein [Anaerolineae bacterium]